MCRKKEKKMKCVECNEREAIALIHKKDVCQRCFDRLRGSKRPLRKSWLDKLEKRNMEKIERLK